MVESSIIVLIAILVHIHLFFLIGLFKQDNSYMSAVWGIGFVLIIFISNLVLELGNLRQNILSLVVSIWGLRLFFHLSYRKLKLKQGEDARYVAMRNTWGSHQVLGSYFNVYILQGFFMFIVALPLIYVYGSNSSADLGSIDYIALSAFFLGLLIEIISDLQLLNFKSNPRNNGKFLTSGLWKYSRHPNYFGEVLLWWGIGLFAFSISPFALISPIILMILLRYVSGVPLLEQKYQGNREFATYKKRTSTFIPWFPKNT